MRLETRLFRKAMMRELKANEYKTHWSRLKEDEMLIFELKHHVSKLVSVIEARNKDIKSGTQPSEWLENRILEFAADVGNCAMFAADNLGVLNREIINRRLAEPNFVENGYERD